jgi:hypothetical protein
MRCLFTQIVPMMMQQVMVLRLRLPQVFCSSPQMTLLKSKSNYIRFNERLPEKVRSKWCCFWIRKVRNLLRRGFPIQLHHYLPEISKNTKEFVIYHLNQDRD